MEIKMTIDVFRKEDRFVTEEQKYKVREIKLAAERLWLTYQEAMEHLGDAEQYGGDGRLMALAKTALEESVMWAVKAIT